MPLKEAIKYLGVSKSLLQNSKEIMPFKIGGRIFCSKQELASWKEKREKRTFYLILEDYARCFDFAVAMYYKGYTVVDWGTARKREAGQNLTNWIRGQLGEIAVQKFFKKNFNLEVELDFDLHKEIVPQDIIGVKEGTAFRNPKTKVAIKATKFQNSYLILGTADVEPENRKSDIYILTRIDLPDDHLLRIAKDELEELLKKQKHFDSYKNKLSGFKPIPCEVVGFAYRQELEKIDNTEQLAKILGTRNPSGARYVKVAGKLRDSIEEWKQIIKKL
ncbi:MAG: hypothetical protein COT90_05880 [Candidatus Diapherotrites archaeon CG10_big_fil_rev_8_21_14_0_10_31_34]|nr:MAG: hypothetical protein COT90_05880 [Candidatus Diapherotrites archaeon CG10_big_fil_rev_8_21_14_0_10_31_34]